MSLPVPNLDDRRFEDLVEEAKQRIQERCPEWTDFNPSDPGMMLVELMAWLTETTLYRLNRVPEKHYVKFLELMGVSLKPAQPAKTMVVFTLANNANEDNVGTIPVGTSISCRGEHGDSIPFCTAQHLNLTTSRILHVVSAYQDHVEDHLADLAKNTKEAPPISLGDQGVPIMDGTQPQEHLLYLGDPGLGEYANLVQLQIALEVEEEDEGGVCVEWEVQDGKDWVPVIPQRDETIGLRQSGTVWFSEMPVKEQSEVNGKEAFWLRARLLATRGPYLPKFRLISRARSLKKGNTIPVERAFLHAQREPVENAPLQLPYHEVDLTSDVFLFGKQPQQGDTAYLKSPIFGKTNTTVFLQVQLGGRGVAPRSEALQNLELRWEYYSNALEWSLLGVTTPAGVSQAEHEFVDETKALTQSGTIQFQVPSTAELYTLQGDQGCYLRVRIMRTPEGKEHPYPPCLSSLRVSFTEHPQTWANVVSKNGQTFADLTSQRAEGKSFIPFVIDADADPSLYVGLDHLPSNKTHQIYLRLVDQADPQARTIVWEYETDNGWTSLPLHQDGTKMLQQSGAIRFLVPTDWVAQARFGGQGFWLRARCVVGVLNPIPRLRGLHCNAVEVIQAQVYTNEILGSSTTGEAFQTFRLLHRPIQPGPRVLVKEIVSPTPKQIQEFRETFPGELDENLTSRQVHELWMPWTEVSNFFYSTAESRHYMLDTQTGRITFGDGRRGRIPPNGMNNIKVGQYAVCRGPRGNIRKGELTDLGTAIPYVEAVANPEAATGGMEQESLAEAKLRGPWVVKHRDRAVTKEDFEELAKQASQEVARARCISHSDEIQILIVPQSDNEKPKPRPTNQLIQTVTSFLNERRLLTTNVRIVGPVYVDVTLAMSLVLTGGYQNRENQIRTEITACLSTFFHPLRGGPEGQGWPIGRTVHLSEMYYLIEQVTGVDYVKHIDLSRSDTVNYKKPVERIPMPEHGFPHAHPVTMEFVYE